jgi:hypothetical protein
MSKYFIDTCVKIELNLIKIVFKRGKGIIKYNKEGEFDQSKLYA